MKNLPTAFDRLSLPWHQNPRNWQIVQNAISPTSRTINIADNLHNNYFHLLDFLYMYNCIIFSFCFLLEKSKTSYICVVSWGGDWTSKLFDFCNWTLA